MALELLFELASCNLTRSEKARSEILTTHPLLLGPLMESPEKQRLGKN